MGPSARTPGSYERLSVVVGVPKLRGDPEVTSGAELVSDGSPDAGAHLRLVAWGKGGT